MKRDSHTPIRLALVDDHELIRSGLRKLFEPENGIAIVGEAANPTEALAVIAEAKPDVVLMDINLRSDVNGLELTRRILASPPAPAIIILTVYEKDDYIVEAVKAGASGFLQKEADGREIVDAVRRAAAGESLIDSALSLRVMENVGGAAKKAADLSPREREIWDLIAEGRSNKEISESLSISSGTIKNHITSLFRKLGVHDRTQAAILALREKES